jgi:hypothetical protein
VAGAFWQLLLLTQLRQLMLLTLQRLLRPLISTGGAITVMVMDTVGMDMAGTMTGTMVGMDAGAGGTCLLLTWQALLLQPKPLISMDGAITVGTMVMAAMDGMDMGTTTMDAGAGDMAVCCSTLMPSMPQKRSTSLTASTVLPRLRP